MIVNSWTFVASESSLWLLRFLIESKLLFVDLLWLIVYNVPSRIHELCVVYIFLIELFFLYSAWVSLVQSSRSYPLFLYLLFLKTLFIPKTLCFVFSCCLNMSELICFAFIPIENRLLFLVWIVGNSCSALGLCWCRRSFLWQCTGSVVGCGGSVSAWCLFQMESAEPIL